MGDGAVCVFGDNRENGVIVIDYGIAYFIWVNGECYDASGGQRQRK